MQMKKLVKKRNIAFVTILFIVLITSFRWIWITIHEPENQPMLTDGNLDLSDWTFTDQSLSLNGEWLFYPQAFTATETTVDKTNVTTVKVPSDWTKALNNTSLDSPSFGYGSYEATIRLPDNHPSVFGLRIKSVHTSARVVVNGEVVKTVNTPSQSFEAIPTFRGPFYTLFSVPKETTDLHIVVEVSNYETPYLGGINKAVTFGTDEAIAKEVNLQEIMQMTVIIILLLHALYALLLFIIGGKFKKKELALFGVMLIFMAIGSAFDDEVFIQLPIKTEYSFRLMTFFYVCLLLFMIQFVYRVFPSNKKVVNMISVTVGTMGILTLGIVPFEHLSILLALYYLLYFIAIAYMIYTTIKYIQKGEISGYFILFFIISYTSNLIWGFLILNDIVDFPFYPFDFIFAILSIALLLFLRYHHVLAVSEKQRERLIEEDQKKDRFLANTSHEIRNPLHAMINIAQILLNEQPHLNNEMKRNLAVLIRIGHQLTFTLNDMLDITKLKEQSKTVEKESVDVKHLTDEVIEMVTFITSKKTVSIENRIDPLTHYVYADRNRLLRIIFNILHNALKFTEEGVVTVQVNVHKDKLTIDIADQGIGMTEKEMERVFLPYEKLVTHLHDAGGIGLGLSITQRLVEQLGGEITVSSKKGVGSVFYITLPVATKKQIIATKQNDQHQREEFVDIGHEILNDSEEANSKLPKILLVDDDHINLVILKSMLEPAYSVVATICPEKALQLIDKNHYDLIISDVMMPKISGYQLTKLIRERFTMSELPILLVTARNQPQDIYTGFLAGANDYIAKPVEALELQARVRALTDLKQSIHKQLQLEAAWLQAQMKPHFIFNTLNAIASLSTTDVDQMIDLIHVFGQYLTGSFSVNNTKPMIPLAEELELVKAYLYINKLRFKERLSYRVDMDDMTNVKLPPLVLQTLVENAMKHGILKRKEGGRLLIEGKRYESFYQLKLSDDGVGIKKELLDDILTSGIPEKHVGLTNTNKRLKKLCNQTLQIDSIEGQGTSIAIDLPYVKEKQ